MKKTLALALIIAFVLSSVATAADKEFDKSSEEDYKSTEIIQNSFPDVDNSHYVHEVDVLNENGIMQGDENGNFRPNDEITRAEFAAVLCRAIGAEEAAKSATMINLNCFTDVPSTYWAAGYINAAHYYSIINGVGDGFFMPEQAVTNEQVIKMLVSAWGYGDEAEELGGYPNGYMEIADKYGVLDTVSFHYGNASKRWVVSMFVCGALEKLPATERKEQSYVITPIEKTSEKKEPMSEYGNGEPEDIVSVLKKITPESAKYEETAYIRPFNKPDLYPFYIDGNNIVYRDIIGTRKVRIGIGKEGKKEGFEVFLTESQCVLNFADLETSEWQFSCTILDGSVKDEYQSDLTKSNEGLSFSGSMWRFTTLHVVPQVITNRTPVSFSNSTNNPNIPFNMRATVNEDGKIVFYMDCSTVLSDEQFFHYSINTDYPVADGRIDGNGAKIEPIIIEGAEPTTLHYFQAFVQSQYIDCIGLKGEITFTLKNGEVDFLFDGNYIDTVCIGNEILDYE